MQWSINKPNIGGILSPDINNCRHFYNLETKSTFLMQIPEKQHPNDLIIGRFIFSYSAFEMANNIITNCLFKQPACIVIDEIGYLELTQKGFYTSLNTILQSNNCNANILLVIRDSLLNTAITTFKLQQHNLQVITQLNQLNLL